MVRKKKGEEIPGYLKKKWGKSRWKRVARGYRLGNKIKNSRYWKKEEKRKCRRIGEHRSMFGRIIKGRKREVGGRRM